MQIRALAAALTALQFVSPASAQIDAKTAAAIREQGLEQSQVMETLDSMTNGIGHRLTGSPNFTQACLWAKEQFEEMGFENVQLEKWDTWPITWNRGQWMGRMLTPEPMEFQVATEAWTNGTKGRQAGPAIAMPGSFDELRSRAPAFEGAWIVGSFPSRRSQEGRELFDQIMEAANEQGALGFAYASSGNDKYPNRMRVFSNSMMRGRSPLFSEAPDDLPRIMVRRDQMAKVMERIENEEEVELEFDIRNRWIEKPIDLHNVIAEIKGTEKPDEVVVVCGHLDSWHQATGATDNGTGATSTLETARILMAIGAKPKRTIRFCLWGGEEQGLLGSTAHTTMRRTEMDKVSVCFNHDTGTNWAHTLSITEAMQPAFEQIMAPVTELDAPDAEHEGPTFRLNVVGRIRGGGGSDHASFLRTGVPGFSWGLTGRSDYFGYTWHTQWDTYDVAIPEYMRHNATVFAMASLGAANLPEMISREGVGGGSRRGPSNLKAQIEGAFGARMSGENNMTFESVRDGGRAADYGVKKGDVLHSVGKTRVKTLVEVVQALRNRSRSETRTLTVRRGGELVVLKDDG